MTVTLLWFRCPGLWYTHEVRLRLSQCPRGRTLLAAPLAGATGTSTLIGQPDALNHHRGLSYGVVIEWRRQPYGSSPSPQGRETA